MDFSWFYDEKTKKMFYEIKEKSDISEEHLEWYEYFKGQKKHIKSGVKYLRAI